MLVYLFYTNTIGLVFSYFSLLKTYFLVLLCILTRFIVPFSFMSHVRRRCEHDETILAGKKWNFTRDAPAGR